MDKFFAALFSGQNIGLGAIALASLYIVWKIIELVIRDKNVNQKLLVDTLNRNSSALEKTSRSMDTNTAATSASIEITKASAESVKSSTQTLGQTVDRFTSSLLSVFTAQANRPPTPPTKP